MILAGNWMVLAGNKMVLAGNTSKHRLLCWFSGKEKCV